MCEGGQGIVDIIKEIKVDSVNGLESLIDTLNDLDHQTKALFVINRKIGDVLAILSADSPNIKEAIDILSEVDLELNGT